MKKSISLLLKGAFALLLAIGTSSPFCLAQNVGIGQVTPVSKLDVSGNMTVGLGYSGTSTAPANGAIIEGNTGIGTATPAHRLHVVGDVRFQGDFINQEINGAHSGTTQAVPFTNLQFTPLTGTTVSITPQDGNGVNNSGVLITGFARVFGGNLDGASSSLGGYFMVLERDTDPTFSGATIMTYTSGSCYLETPNGFVSAAIGYGGGGHISYVDNGLTAGTTYYYRLTIVPNSVGVNSGTFDVYQRDLNILQIKR
jgi:hypothetical protein